jgi:hypothetical protein
LATDLDLFYELAFGSQAPGYRDTAYQLNLEQNAKLITDMLTNVFATTPGIGALRKNAFATAHYAIGLVAYNTNRKDLSRRMLLRAMAARPKLLLDQKFLLTFVKSFIHLSLIRRLKRSY